MFLSDYSWVICLSEHFSFLSIRRGACGDVRSVRARRVFDAEEEGMTTRDDGEMDASADDACALTPSEGTRD